MHIVVPDQVRWLRLRAVALILWGVPEDPRSGKSGTSLATIREYGADPPVTRCAGYRNERGATRVTASVNPNQSTGQPAGCKACGLFSFESRWQVSGKPVAMIGRISRKSASLASPPPYSKPMTEHKVGSC